MRLFRSYAWLLFALTVTCAEQQAALAQGPAVQVIPIEPGIHFSIASRSPDWINAIGEIDEHAAERFKQFLSANDDVVRPGTMVQFSSPGGRLGAAIMLGMMIHNLGFDTLVGDSVFLNGGAVCASACTMAFIGGVNRILNLNARFEVHAPRLMRPDGSEFALDEKVLTPEDLFFEQRTMSFILRYVVNQGVDPCAMATMYEVSPYGTRAESIRSLTHEEIVRWRISNTETPPPGQERSVLRSDEARRAFCLPDPPAVGHDLPSQ